jgi:LysM repeat protein
MAISTLQDLQQYLQSQATSNEGTITLDGTFLDSRVIALINTTFHVNTGSITLTQVSASNITLSSDQTTLYMTSAQTPSSDSQTFLHLTSMPTNVAFQLVGSEFNIILQVQPPSAWTFGDSLDELKLLTVPGWMNTGSQYLYFSTFTAAQPLPSFPNAALATPAAGPVSTGDSTPTIEEGLNYYAVIELTGIFALAPTLLGISNTLAMWGTVDASISQPTFDLRAPTGISDLSIGFINVNGPWVGMKVIYPTPPSGGGDEAYFGEVEEDLSRGSLPEALVLKDDGGGEDALPQIIYYIGTAVSIETNSSSNGGGTPALGFELDVIFQNPESGQVVLQIVSTESEALSLGSLASVLMDTTDADITSKAGPLVSVLESITLKQFSAMVQVSRAGVMLMNTRAVVGTDPPWTMPVAINSTNPTLDLTLDWQMMYPSGSPAIWSVTFAAVLTFTSALSFELDVMVSGKDLTIEGKEHGSVTLSLADLLQAVAGVTSPVDLSATFTDFTVTIGVMNSTYVVSGTIDASFSLFGTQLLAIENMGIGVAVDTSNSNLTVYSANMNGQIALGSLKVQTSAVITNKANVDTVFSMHLVDETLGSMLNHLVHLVDPTYDISFPSPWNAILDVRLDALELDVNVSKNIVTLSYSLNLDLGFITLTAISLQYTAASQSTPSSTVISLSGSFLGQSFGSGGGSSNPPLAWDAINENPPSIPGQGRSLFDLQYAGLGQHITFTNLSSMRNIQEVMTAMQASVLPSPSGALPAFGQNGLAFSQEIGWLIGAQFTVMSTVSLAAIFNDPNLYGIQISLAGQKAGSFAGLSFQILYRKISDTIGVYHIELKFPDAMRTLQFGAVSLTLPIAIIDIYTNGNFKVNLGFPNGLDFSNSFSVQVFPFVGYGGFYFALLDGSTSSRVPQITNGTFSPVIEFGVALSIGVGKTVNYGILSGGITVTVTGILQGTLAWFNPTSVSTPSDVYYWFQGMIAITGRLYATINFAIIQASVDVTAYASVTLTIQSYSPIYIAINAGVSVSVKVKILFITIHCSFKATVSASFTIGSSSPTPWVLASGSGANAVSSVRRLRGQRTLHRARVPMGMRKVLRREAARERVRLRASGASAAWPQVLVYPEMQTLTLSALPSFTKSTTANTVNAVMLLTAENSADPSSTTIRQQRVLVGDDPSSTPFNVLAEGMLRWGIWTQTGGNGIITADHLAELQVRLQSDANAFDAGTVSGFFAANFSSVTIGLAPNSGNTGAAVFPIFPELSLSTSDGVSVNFNVTNSVCTQYQTNIPAYFQLLQTQYLARTGSAPSANTTALATDDDTNVSMAAIVYAQYFWMLMGGAVQAAVDYLASFPYTTLSAMTLQQLATATDPTLTSDPSRVVEPNLDTGSILNVGAYLALTDVLHQVMLGDSFGSIATTFSGLGAYNFDSAPQPLSASDIAAANLATANIFNTGISVPITGITYSTNVGDTLNLIAARLLIRAGGNSMLATIQNLQPAIAAFSGANTSITDPTSLITAGTSITVPATFSSVAAGPYIAVASDTLTLIGAYFAAVAQGVVPYADYVTQIQAANESVASTDPNTALNAGISLDMPSVTRVLQAGDSMSSIALTLLTTSDVIQTVMVNVTTEDFLSPQAVLSVPLQYKLSSSDMFSGIASKFSLTTEQLSQAVGASGATLFAENASLLIADVSSIDTDALVANLVNQGEWNNLSGYVSRFFLSGLQVPDPNSAAFASATPEQLVSTPSILATFPTVPLYAATAQQFLVNVPPASDYQITLSNSGSASWLQFTGGSTLPITLTADQLSLINTISTTAVNPVVDNLSRLALFQMIPPRIALQQYIAWQAASLPAGCFTTGQATTNPSLWLFPTALIDQLQSGAAQYEFVAGTQSNPNQNLNVKQVGCYAWGTIVDVRITLPVVDGPSDSVSNAYVVQGADDADADVLQALYTYLTTSPGSSDSAFIYLLYSPSPTSTNPSGLVSDQIDTSSTFLLKTNLSTVTSSGSNDAQFVLLSDPTDQYDALISDATDFIALLWEASITRSGGFYLQYVNQNGGAALPESVFGNSTSATLSVLVLLQSQLTSVAAPVQTFNNCAVVGANIDPSTTNVFVQPVTALAGALDTLTTLSDWYNKNWKVSLQPSLQAADVANLNADVQLLLQPGLSITLPDNNSYTIKYGDTFQSVATAHSTTVTALATAGTNATTPIFQPGAQVQFATDVLQPASTVPPGTVGFEMTRQIPDSDNDPVDTLFNLVGWSVASADGFMASGEGLPTTPSESDQDGSDGLTPRPLDDTEASEWNYSQSMNVAPFAKTTNGSSSPALPSAQWNPHNGIGEGTEVTLDLEFQDIYGNEAQVAQYGSIQIPVGYYDQLVNFGSWPSMAMAYAVTSAASPVVNIDLSLTMQQARYIPSGSLPFASAQQAIQADLQTYVTIYYQLAQPDVTMTLATSLAPGSGNVAISITPFAMFARSAYVFLNALNQLTAVAAAGASVSSLASTYQVTAAQLFAANSSQLYSTLFGTTVLSVPKTYTTVENDTLNSIVAQFSSAPYNLTVTILATNNSTVPLDAGADLRAPSRRTTASKSDSLSSIAVAMQASPASIASANASLPILQGTVTFTVGTQSYTTSDGDTFINVAAKIGATVAAVADANQYTTGIFVDQSALTITDVVVASGDSLQTLAAQFASSGFTVAGLATANETMSNFFAPGTSLIIGTNPNVTVPAADDTLDTFATANSAGIDQLATYNSSASFLSAAQISIPGLVAGASSLPYSIYPAVSSDTLGGIASKFTNATADTIATLNADLPGLLAGGETVTDTTSGKSVTTQDGDTFNSIIARFQSEQTVTVTLAQLAADVSSQQNLLVGDALWITPPMLAANSGTQPANSLAGFAAQFNLDPVGVATANAASQGFLQPQISFTAQFAIGSSTVSVPITTGTNETFNSLVTKVANAGYTVTIAEVANAVLTVASLLNPSAVAVPLVSPVAASQTVTPSFTETIFPISVTLVTNRNTRWVDPDFADVTSVYTSSYSVSAQSLPDDDGNLNIEAFAKSLQDAIPGIAVATGQADGTPGNAPVTIWGVNFSSSISTPVALTFGEASSVQFFALPPLSTSLLSGTFNIQPYITGSGLGAAVSQTFQAVDLDVWLNTFLSAIDLVLSSSYAVPGYSLSPTAIESLIGCKADLALYVSQRVEYVLSGASSGSLADAQTALYQAMLNQLSNAITVNTLVQVPVTVSSTFSGDLAPLLSGKITVPGATPDEVNAFSFSTTKIDLADGASTATFLFTVKSPASQPNATLNMQYDIVEMEVPTGPALIGEYQPSNWLRFILARTPESIGSVEIPIPLRAYPSPVALVSQVAQQAVCEPASVSDLLLWNFDFVYQHQDAQQDSPTVQVTFGSGASTLSAFGRGPRSKRLRIGRHESVTSGVVNVQGIFQNLAQFMAVWPALQADLGLLPYTAPGTTTIAAQVAIETFEKLVGNVLTAWYQTDDALFAGISGGKVYTWAMQKEGTSDMSPTLSTLTISAPPNPTELWPVVYATWNGEERQLTPVGSPTTTQAVYQYPSGIPLNAVLPQRFVFNVAELEELRPVLRLFRPMDTPSASATQTYQFNKLNVLESTSGLAGVSIMRNGSLISGTPTNSDFVYQTPLSSFPNAAVPSIFASNAINIGSGDTSGIAAALQSVFETLFADVPSGSKVNIRLACSYSYTLATAISGGGTNAVTTMPALLPVFLVPSYAFNPQTDEDPNTQTSFVAQVQWFIDEWTKNNGPKTTNGAFAFDLTVLSPNASSLQPLIRATTLLYSL